MSQNSMLEVLSQINALITSSHIVYTSGKHGSAYINKDAIYPHTEITSQLCEHIAKQFVNSNVDVVLAPAVGGVILSQWVAYHLTKLTGREVYGVYAEKCEAPEYFVIKRGYDKLCRNKRVLVVEDMLTTGGTVKKVVAVARNIPCEVVGVAALCNRGGITAKDLGDVPTLYALADIKLEAWEANECPLCQADKPINIDVGKGREFLATKA